MDDGDRLGSSVTDGAGFFGRPVQNRARLRPRAGLGEGGAELWQQRHAHRVFRREEIGRLGQKGRGRGKVAASERAAARGTEPRRGS